MYLGIILLTYIGYVSFLPASLVGPVFEYSDYENYLNRTENYKNLPNTFKAMVKEGKIFVLCLLSYIATMKISISETVTD